MYVWDLIPFLCYCETNLNKVNLNLNWLARSFSVLGRTLSSSRLCWIPTDISTPEFWTDWSSSRKSLPFIEESTCGDSAHQNIWHADGGAGQQNEAVCLLILMSWVKTRLQSVKERTSVCEPVGVWLLTWGRVVGKSPCVYWDSRLEEETNNKTEEVRNCPVRLFLHFRERLIRPRWWMRRGLHHDPRPLRPLFQSFRLRYYRPTKALKINIGKYRYWEKILENDWKKFSQI